MFFDLDAFMDHDGAEKPVQRDLARFESEGGAVQRKPDMTHVNTGLLESAKRGITSAARGSGDIAQTSVSVVSGTLATALEDADRVGASATEAIRDIAGGAIRGGAQVGANLEEASRGIVIGVLRGTQHSGIEAMNTIGQTAMAVVRNAADAGGQLGLVATGLVEGAVQSARGIGVTTEEAASSAAHGALRAADRISAAAFRTVRQAVTQTIYGVRVALKAPFDQPEGRPRPA